MNTYQNIPYTYLIGWSWLNIWYYGRRTAKGCHPDDLWVSYWTSSHEVERYRELHGEPDIIIIKKTFESHETDKCVLWEHKVLRRLDAKKHPKMLNKHNGGVKLDTSGLISVRDKDGNTMSVSVDDPRYLFGELLHTSKNTKWWNNGIDNTMSVDCPGENWIEESLFTSNKGFKWWNNGSECVMTAECPGEEWVNGQLPGYCGTTGKKWWNNGIEQKVTEECPGKEWVLGGLKTKTSWNNGVNFKVSEECPGEGWVQGGLPTNKGTRFWNNGIEQVMRKECPGEGWTRGMVPRV